MDKIIISQLEVISNHGVLDAEKVLGQKFYVSIELALDLQKAGISDDIRETINYAEVCDMVVRLMQNSTYNLIETCAEKIAESLLKTHTNVNEVTVTIEKPHAPIKHSFGNVAVLIIRKRETVYIGLGSNMGDREANLSRAISAMSVLPDLAVIKSSAFHETKPVSHTPQRDYLNAVVMAHATCSPAHLMEILLELEINLGRERPGIPLSPRVIDLDLLFYGNVVSESAFVTLPHPRLHERLFVLEPFCEVNPLFVHPLKKKRIFELKDEMKAAEDISSRLTLTECFDQESR